MNQELVRRAEQAVFASAQHLLLAIREGRALGTRRKADATIVTVLDVESQEIICEALRDTLPIVAEEDPESHSGLSNENFILLDPLDGTTACRRFSHLPPGQVGFGPLVGLCEQGTLKAAIYADIPSRCLYTAVRGEGAFVIPFADWSSTPQYAGRERLRAPANPPPHECALLLFPGAGEREFEAARKLKNALGLETMYRFGGFANDCSRAARGLEQLVVQFSLKAWDLSAALIAHEAGLAVVVDPIERAVELDSYRIELRSKVLISPPSLMSAALQALRV